MSEQHPSEAERDEPALECDWQAGAQVPATRASGHEDELDAPVSGETEPLVMSHGNMFCVVNRHGDITPPGARDLGLFYEDMRHLSRLELLISSGRATVLSASTGSLATSQVDLTLTDYGLGGFLDDPQNFLHVRRRQLVEDIFVEHISLTNHLRRAVDLPVELRLGADFVDIFQVRGARRARRGRHLPPQIGPDHILFGYLGVDGELYRTLVRLQPTPSEITPGGAIYRLHFQPGETILLELLVQPLRGEQQEVPWQPFYVRCEHLQRQHTSFLEGSTKVHCDNNRFEAILERAMADIDSLRIAIARPQGEHQGGRQDAPGWLHILGAGIPWYAAPFGRDAIITSLELLSVTPHLAVETLRTLAVFQGEKDDPWHEEEPGKILHELRRGEMARAGEIPHSPYYGTIDATPLWLMLLGETWRWTGDDALVDELEGHAERALAWMERRLVAGGGWVRYQRTHARGLENQGWKDSRDGVSFPDGTLAQPPIALVEVQGYVVAAFEVMARLRRRRGDARSAHALRQRAQALRQRINEAFWMEDVGYYALALDGEGRRVPTISSNPGHLALGRAVPAERMQALAEMLLSEEMYSGWGIRTVARGQAVFNPLSYHNGTVWPHDNAMCALGLALSGQIDEAVRICEGLYAAVLQFRDLRLPELFCGMSRGHDELLVHYPVSCAPQAWASGAFYLLLQAALGIQPDAPLGRLVIRNPRLPSFLHTLRLEGMRVGRTAVTLHFERHGARTHVDLIDVVGDGRLKVNIEIG